MYFLATICLLNFLTVRGTDDEKTIQEKFDEKIKNQVVKVKGDEFASPKVEANAAYTKCVKDLTDKKYKEADDAKWAKNAVKAAALKKECIDEEKQICQWTNGDMTKFIEKLKGQEQEICTNMRKGAVLACKTNIIGNDKCKAECDKISSVSNLTITVLLAFSTLAFVSK